MKRGSGKLLYFAASVNPAEATKAASWSTFGLSPIVFVLFTKVAGKESERFSEEGKCASGVRTLYHVLLPKLKNGPS